MAEDKPLVPQAPQTVDIAKSDLPEADLDSLLAATPQLAAIFGDSESGKKTEPKKEPAQAAEAPAEEQSQQIELDTGLPLVESPVESPPEPVETTEEEQPKPEHDAVQKRIDELTARRKSAEEKLIKLEAELTTLKSRPPAIAPTLHSPLANVSTLQELAERARLAQIAESWLIRHIDGGEMDIGDGKTQLLSGDQVKDLLARAVEMRSRHLPERYQWLVNKAAWDKQAQAAYPALFKEGSKEQIEYNELVRTVPQLGAYADVSMIVGHYLRGKAFYESRVKQAPQGANGQVPPLQKSAPAAAPKVPQKQALNRQELSQIAVDPQSNMFDRFVRQLIDDHAAQRSKR